MSLIRQVLFVALLMFCSAVSAEETPSPATMLSELHLLHPIWDSPVVYRESAIVLQPEAGKPGVAKLALPAEEILSVTSATGEQKYKLGADFELAADGLSLLFAADTKVPLIQASQLYPPEGSPMSYRHRVGHPEQNMLYGPGRWFHDHQIEVTYKPKQKLELAHPPTISTKLLPKTLARLKAKQPITLGVSGDSISAGGDASALANAPPKMPPFCDLVAAQLEASTGAKVTLKNRAVGGWSVANGVGDLEKLLAEKPNVVIVAYGMNDVGRRDPAWFRGQTKSIVDKIQATDPEIEIILVAPMLGHSEWVHTPREMFAKYRDELQSLTGPGVALADLTDVWAVLLKTKHDLDLTGNGLNHPNDFGHRLYASAILQLLIADKK